MLLCGRELAAKVRVKGSTIRGSKEAQESRDFKLKCTHGNYVIRGKNNNVFIYKPIVAFQHSKHELQYCSRGAVFVSSANVDAANEYARQGEVVVATEDGVELVAEVGDAIVRP